MKFDKVDFNPKMATLLDEDGFIAANQHQWPGMDGHRRNSTLSRVYQLLGESIAEPIPHGRGALGFGLLGEEGPEMIVNPKPFTDERPNSSGDASEIPGTQSHGDTRGSDTGESEGSGGAATSPTVPKGRKGRRDEAGTV